MLIQQLKEDKAIAAVDTLLHTVPNQLGVDYNAHVIDGILDPRGTRARLAINRLATSKISPRLRRGLAPYPWPGPVGGMSNVELQLPGAGFRPADEVSG